MSAILHQQEGRQEKEGDKRRRIALSPFSLSLSAVLSPFLLVTAFALSPFCLLLFPLLVGHSVCLVSFCLLLPLSPVLSPFLLSILVSVLSFSLLFPFLSPFLLVIVSVLVFVLVFLSSCLPSCWPSCLPSCWSLRPCLNSVPLCLRSCLPSWWSLCPSSFPGSPALLASALFPLAMQRFNSFVSKVISSLFSPNSSQCSLRVSALPRDSVSDFRPACHPFPSCWSLRPPCLPSVSFCLPCHCVRLVSLLFAFVSLLVSFLAGHCVRCLPLSRVLPPFLLVTVSLLFPFVYLLVSLLVGHRLSLANPFMQYNCLPALGCYVCLSLAILYICFQLWVAVSASAMQSLNCVSPSADCCVRHCLAILCLPPSSQLHVACNPLHLSRCVYMCLPALDCCVRLCLAILCLPALDVTNSSCSVPVLKNTKCLESTVV